MLLDILRRHAAAGCSAVDVLQIDTQLACQPPRGGAGRHKLFTLLRRRRRFLGLLGGCLRSWAAAIAIGLGGLLGLVGSRGCTLGLGDVFLRRLLGLFSLLLSFGFSLFLR